MELELSDKEEEMEEEPEQEVQDTVEKLPNIRAQKNLRKVMWKYKSSWNEDKMSSKEKLGSNLLGTYTKNIRVLKTKLLIYHLMNENCYF